MSRAWQTGSVDVAMNELRILIREEGESRSPESVAIAACLGDEEGSIRKAVRVVSRRKVDRHSSWGVDRVMERRRVSKNGAACPHCATAAR
ncbi:MAG: hypothetical protein HY093_02700 [Candidatus Liptonbacteria bacterium]|nr:hypothetical protein [Candidatus Liptonbacteria bacterium]